MSTAVLSYEPERIRALVVRARAVAEHLASAPPDDPLAAEAATTAATVHAHVSEHWLPALAAVEASRALLDPIDLTNAEALAAAHSAVVAGQPGVFVGTTKTYEVLETSPTTTIPTTGHDPDAGSGRYDIVVTDHWYEEYNLGQRPAVFAATPGGIPSIVARFFGRTEVPDDVMERGRALEAEARQARETAGGSIRPQRNVAVGRLTKSDDEVVGYRTVSGEAPRRASTICPKVSCSRSTRIGASTEDQDPRVGRAGDRSGGGRCARDLHRAATLRLVRRGDRAIPWSLSECPVAHLLSDRHGSGVTSLDDQLRRLMNAIEMDDRDLVARLLDSGIMDLDAVDPEWQLSPLALAVDAEADGASHTGSQRDLALVRLLVDAGASPLVPGHRGKTALDIARDYDWPEAIELLQRAVDRRSA